MGTSARNYMILLCEEEREMSSLYDRADIYDLIETDERFDIYRRHWKCILQGIGVNSLLDVSIGSGNVTLPLADLGVELYGSDLSKAMLNNCRKKADRLGCNAKLQQSDFRDLRCWQDKKFDCVASTGNSLPHVPNSEVPGVLAQMDSLVAEGGYLYIDTRNWDRILRERQRFYLYNPFFDGETRVNLMQVWDYLEDDSMRFNLLYTFEKDNRIFQKEIFEEQYYPLPRKLLLNGLAELGYRDIRQFCFPACFEQNAEDAEWYCVLAKKTANKSF